MANEPDTVTGVGFWLLFPTVTAGISAMAAGQSGYRSVSSSLAQVR